MKKLIFPILFAFPLYIVFNNVLHLFIDLIFGHPAWFRFYGYYCEIRASDLSAIDLFLQSPFTILKFCFLSFLLFLYSSKRHSKPLAQVLMSWLVYDLLGILAYALDQLTASRTFFNYYFSNAEPYVLSHKIGLADAAIPILFCAILSGLAILAFQKQHFLNRELASFIVFSIAGFLFFMSIMELYFLF